MDTSDFEAQIIVTNFLEFLADVVETGNLSTEHKTSIAMAVNCLEQVYGITSDVRASISAIYLSQQTMIQLEESPNEEELAAYNRYLGNLAMVTDDYQSALILYEKAIEGQPFKAEYFANRAEAHCRLDEKQKAVADWNHALSLEPNNSKVHTRMGYFYYSLNNWKEAVRSLQKALNFDPENKDLRFKLGVAMSKFIDSTFLRTPRRRRRTQVREFINYDAYLPFAKALLESPKEPQIKEHQIKPSSESNTSDDDLKDYKTEI